VRPDEFSHPELVELSVLLGREAALLLSRAPGSWRSMGETELEGLGLSAKKRHQVQVLQTLVTRGYGDLRGWTHSSQQGEVP
jgi:hypothetical protein